MSPPSSEDINSSSAEEFKRFNGHYLSDEVEDCKVEAVVPFVYIYFLIYLSVSGKKLAGLT